MRSTAAQIKRIALTKSMPAVRNDIASELIRTARTGLNPKVYSAWFDRAKQYLDAEEGGPGGGNRLLTEEEVRQLVRVTMPAKLRRPPACPCREPGCGGFIKYNINTGKLHCSNCWINTWTKELNEWWLAFWARDTCLER